MYHDTVRARERKVHRSFAGSALLQRTVSQRCDANCKGTCCVDVGGPSVRPSVKDQLKARLAHDRATSIEVHHRATRRRRACAKDPRRTYVRMYVCVYVCTYTSLAHVYLRPSVAPVYSTTRTLFTDQQVSDSPAADDRRTLASSSVIRHNEFSL